MRLEEIKITMLGTTGAGKTSYLLGMYAVMQTGVQGFTLAAKDMDLDLELTQRWEKLISLKGEDPWPTPNAATMEYYGFDFSYGFHPFASQQILQLNDLTKYPDQAYLYPSLNSSNQLLWNTSIQCSQPTSTCLNIKGKFLNNSPFLNQTITKLPEFQIKERIVTREKHNVSSAPENLAHQSHSSLSQRISHRAQEDLDLTIQQATKVATASQELINSFTNWSNQGETNSETSDTDSPAQEKPENFGFKTKKSSVNKQDWF